jgi:hypothetical protein
MVALARDWLDDPRLDLADRDEIEVLCAAFTCRPTDVYVAVAMVGDRLCDIRTYLVKLLRQRQGLPAVDMTTMTSLPPLWSSPGSSGESG